MTMRSSVPRVFVLVLIGCGDAGTATSGGSEGTQTGASEAAGSGSDGSASAVPTSSDGASDAGDGDSAGSGSDPGDPGEPGTSGDGDASTGDASTAGATTGGVDGACADPSAPGCTACMAMGQPQRLFGLTWNFAQGEAGSGLGSEELRCIVPETGESDLIAAIPGMDWLPVGSNAYDRAAGILYAHAYANSDNVTRIFSIDTITGSLLANPATEPQFNWSGGIYVRSDAALVGVTWNPDLLQEEVRALDPASGQTTFMAAIPEIESLAQAVYAFDVATDTAFMIGGAKGEPGLRLFAVDVMVGALVGQPVFEETIGWSGGMFVRSDGQLVGVGLVDGVSRLFAVDAATAAITEIAEIPTLAAVALGSAVYDDVAGTIVIVDGDHRLVQVDALTGEVVASPQLAGPPNPMYQYNWSGGLHVR